MQYTEEQFIEDAKQSFALAVDNTPYLYDVVTFAVENAGRYGSRNALAAMRNACSELAFITPRDTFEDGLTEEQIETRRANSWHLRFADMEDALADTFCELWQDAWGEDVSDLF